MTRRIALLLCLAASARGATLVSQEDFTPAGMRGAYLLRDAGARSAGLGGAFIAVADEPSSVAVNPAGIGQIAGLGVSLAYDGAGNGLGVSEAAAALPVGRGVVAARFALAAYGEVDARDDVGAPLGAARFTDVAVCAGYARPNPEFLGVRGSWGVALSAGSDTAGDLLLLGVHLGWMGHLSDTLTTAVAIRNLGPLPSGRAPVVAGAGGAYTLGDRLARFSLDAGYGIGDGGIRVSGGVELPALARPGETGHRSPIAIRLGYRGEPGARSRGGADGISAGLGLRRGRFQVDLAFQSYGELGGGVRAGVTWQVRPEILSGR